MLQPLLDLIASAAQWIVDSIRALFVEFFNLIISSIGGGLQSIVDLLPAASNLQTPEIDPSLIGTSAGQFWGNLCWFLPVAGLINVITCVCASWLVYFSVAPMLRWAKVIK